MPWSTLFNRRVVFDAIEMSDWRMFVEVLPDGRHNFPASRRASAGSQRVDDDAAVRACVPRASSPTEDQVRRGARWRATSM